MVYVFLANGFEETEAICPIDIMRRAGIDVRLVSVSDDKNVRSSHGITVTADKLINEVSVFDEGLELVMLPGGVPGTPNLYECKPLRDLLVEASRRDIKLAAICAAPMILGKLGILSGHTAVCYPGYEDELIGAKIPKREKVAVSGNIVTAVGMGASTEFGLAIVRMLRSEESSDKIAKSIRFR